MRLKARQKTAIKKVVKNTSKIINGLIIILLAIFLIFNLYNIISRVAFKNDMPKMFSYATAVVISGSMEDTISVGDYIIIKEQDDYKVDDIITYSEGNMIITHRLIEITDTGYITKGDNNNTVDNEISYAQIEGKVVAIIPKMGSIINFFKTPQGMILLFLLVIGIISINNIKERKSSRDNEYKK